MVKHKIDIKKNHLSWEKKYIKICDKNGCKERGEFRAPKSRISLNEYYFFCLDHVKEYNKSWDFYKGLSVNQIENSMREDIIWNRPSWPLKGNPHNVIEQINNFFNDSIKEINLDRINNDLGHNKDNVKIACLGCNLKRRRLNMDKFLFTKQLKIQKKE